MQPQSAAQVAQLSPLLQMPSPQYPPPLLELLVLLELLLELLFEPPLPELLPPLEPVLAPPPEGVTVVPPPAPPCPVEHWHAFHPDPRSAHVWTSWSPSGQAQACCSPGAHTTVPPHEAAAHEAATRAAARAPPIKRFFTLFRMSPPGRLTE